MGGGGGGVGGICGGHELKLGFVGGGQNIISSSVWGVTKSNVRFFSGGRDKRSHFSSP